MLTVTFSELRKNGACPSGYRKLAKYKGGILKFGKRNPFPLLDILDSNGLDDALWSLRACEPAEERDRIDRLFACDCAEHVLVNFERVFPSDNRPRHAIEVSRRFASGQATLKELSAAWAASKDAGSAARTAGAALAAWSASESYDPAAARTAGSAASAAWAASESCDSAAARTAGETAVSALAAWAASETAEAEHFTAESEEKQYQSDLLRKYLEVKK